ncbi:MAG: 2-phosphosulfolactate phosphatase [Spirochaetes bacterium]|nr:2-phosphosulfolactate phosphatase [Spirochaetota bacterium]
MNIQVFESYQTVSDDDLRDRDVVVMDVFRTTSVIITALVHGAGCVIPVESVDEAWDVFRRDKTGRTLLGGERQALPIEGFHLDNSPNSYTEEKVRGRNVVCTTSNGTQAIKGCLEGKRIYIASFFNVSAVSEELRRKENDVVLVCSGTFGRFALEDGLCAGMIASSLGKKAETTLNDLGAAMTALSDCTTDMRSLLKKGSLAYEYLERTGYEDDIALCLQTDLYDVVPFYSEGHITL